MTGIGGWRGLDQRAGPYWIPDAQGQLASSDALPALSSVSIDSPDPLGFLSTIRAQSAQLSLQSAVYKG